MRGHDEQQGGMFSYISADKRVPQDHPLRGIRRMTDVALQTMSPLFAQLYSRMGRPSIAPEKLLRALLLQAFYSVRSERLLMEQLDYNLLFRWFVGMNVDDAVCDASGAQGRTRSGGSDGDAGGGKTEQPTPKRRNASGADTGRGQELSGRGIHQEAAGVAGGAAYCGVRKRDALKQELALAERAGRSGICHQPGETETGRKDIWVDEEFSGNAQNKIRGG